VRSAERSDAGAEGSDAGVEQVADRRPPPPPDRPGQEPEGVPSRLDARRAAAAAEEQADDEPATDLPEPASDRDTEASATSAAGEDDRPAPDPPDAPAGRVPLERTDQPYEVESPQIVRDYYTNIPPTEQDRYLTRDQSDPVPVFEVPPLAIRPFRAGSVTAASSRRSARSPSIGLTRSQMPSSRSGTASMKSVCTRSPEPPPPTPSPGPPELWRLIG
jgi:hypothetical protein